MTVFITELVMLLFLKQINLQCGTHRVIIMPICHHLFSPWPDSAFLQAGVLLELVSRHVVVTTDAFRLGRGSVSNRHAASVSWTGPSLQWHTSCLELMMVLLAVLLALHQF